MVPASSVCLVALSLRSSTYPCLYLQRLTQQSDPCTEFYAHTLLFNRKKRCVPKLGPGRFGGQQSSIRLLHTIPYRALDTL